MKIGAQLYTVRDFTQTQQDLAQTLKKVSDIGYRYVHCSKLGPIAPENLKELLDQNDLTCAVTHVDPQRLLENLSAVLQEHRIIGCKDIGMSIMPERYRGSLEGLRAMIRNFAPVAKRIKDEGMRFHYHNHDVEFIREGRSTLLDILLQEMPDMSLLLCAFWAQVGGASPLALLERYKERIQIIHLKDMAVYPDSKSVGDHRLMTPVLEGNMDYAAILRACAANPSLEYAIVEQDQCQGSPFDCLETSLHNIQELGYGVGGKVAQG